MATSRCCCSSLTIVTGVYWLAERFVFLPRGARAAAVATSTRQQARAARARADGHHAGRRRRRATARQTMLRQPWWLDWTAGLFPVILVVFVLRSFLFEPFKIPSGSMIPTLLVGDLILVNKFDYGIRLPVINTKLTDGKPPQRGDVMVFRYPPRPSRRLHQARGRRAGRRGGVLEQAAHHQRQAGARGRRCPTSSTRTRMRYSKQFSEDARTAASTAS